MAKTFKIPICPVCSKKNVSPAHILGHASAGIPRQYSPQERAARAARAANARKSRWPDAKNN